MKFPAIVLMLAAAPAMAAPAPPGFKPYYVSQRGTEAFLREGPSYQHKVLWVYRHRGYPFLVTASFDVWRRVETEDGTVGWISATVLSDQRTVLVTGKDRVQLHERENGGKVVGLADPGAIAALRTCSSNSCRIKSEEIDGWVARNRIWGIGPDEVFK
jgi:SH3-like domain-containing protein